MSGDQGFVLHPLASQDMTEIWEYIAADTPLAAGRVREEIHAAMRGATAPQHDFAAGARGWSAGGLSFISVKERTTPEPENQYETQFDFANRWLYRSQRNQQTWFLYQLRLIRLGRSGFFMAHFGAV